MESDLSFILTTTAANDSQTIAPAFADGLAQCFFAFSSEHFLPAGILERCLLLAPIPRPASILDKRWASRACRFFRASLNCSPRIRFLFFWCLFFCHAQIDAFFLVSFSFILRLFFFLGSPLLVATLLLFASSLSSLHCFQSFVTCARLLITHSSSPSGLLAKRGFAALITFLIKKSLSHQPSSPYPQGNQNSFFLQAPFLQRLSRMVFSIRSSSTHSWPPLTRPALLLLFHVPGGFGRLRLPESGGERSCLRMLFVGSQSDCSSDQDSTQVQPDWHFCGRSSVIDPSQRSSGAGEGGPLQSVDHCHPFFLHLTVFFLKKVSS